MTELQIPATHYSPAKTQGTIWLVVIAPLIAGLYYLSLRGAFAFSLSSVVADASDVAEQALGGPEWGSHWFYRAFAEAVSVPFGIFIAAGVAQARAKIAGLVSGLVISAVYLIKNVGLLYVFYRWPGYYEVTEPWSQHIVDVLIVIGAPYAGYFIGQAVLEGLTENPVGFAGINRLHFIWLWFAVSAYAAGVIAPLLNAWVGSIASGGYGDTIRGIVLGVPVLAYALPAFAGLGVLAEQNNRRRVFANVVGPLILIVGWFLATGVVYLWDLLVRTVAHAIFG